MGDKLKKYTFTIDVEVTAGQLGNIFTTALEGGIDYWSVCDEYRWENLPPEKWYAKIREDDDESKEHTVTIDTIREGLVRLSRREAKCNLNGQADALKRLALGILRNPEDYDYDAGAADNIVQAGLFNEIVYG